MENILAVAAAIVQYAVDNNQPVNCFELQKLLIRLQQQTVEETGNKCFADEPEQWRSGLVFRTVWITTKSGDENLFYVHLMYTNCDSKI